MAFASSPRAYTFAGKVPSDEEISETAAETAGTRIAVRAVIDGPAIVFGTRKSSRPKKPEGALTLFVSTGARNLPIFSLIADRRMKQSKFFYLAILSHGANLCASK